MTESGGRAGREVRLTEILRPEHVVAPLAASSVYDAVMHLAQALVGTGGIADPDTLRRKFSESRVRDLIHIGDRVLLPHLRTDAVDSLQVALGIAPAPLRESADHVGAVAQVVVLVLAPLSAADLYLQTVAALARVLRVDSVVDRLVAARSPAEVMAIPEIREIIIEPRLRVRDVMTQRVYRTSPDAPVQEVLDLIAEHRLRAIPVVGDDRQVLGMVTDRDLLRHFLPGVQRPAEASAAAWSETRVRDVMSRSVICVSEEQALAEVTSMLVSKDIERLPVVHEGQLTGFLTRGDILRKVFGFAASPIEPVDEE
ncbi:MAG TPA: CBS domain-containing protein [Longimicrobium sp.]|uniref:CBS domain-containing protein n=1 Tax=Longimicrobium sp. TaxID=2029185 RepID=UPI002ED91F5C